MATTVASRIERTRRYLGVSRRTLNRLDGAATDSATDLTLEFAITGIGPGSVLAIDDELVHVWDTDSAAKTVTVERGYEGTTAATHTDGTVVEVDARFPRPEIKDTLKEEIASWPATVFRVDTATLTGSTTTRAYDLGLTGTEFFHVLDVSRAPYATAELGGNTSWVNVTGRVQRNMPLADFASGTALFLDTTLDRTADLLVTYAAPFDLSTFDDATDLEADVGLAPYMVDIPTFGAAWRLLSGTEAERSDTRRQGEPRNAEEVPSGAAISTAGAMLKLRDRRLSEAAMRLREEFGMAWG